MDIGGGTSNLALIQGGRILDTACFNVGGRLLRFDEKQTVTYVSPVLSGLTDLQVGDRITEDQARDLAGKLAEVLEMAAGLRAADSRLSSMVTREGKPLDRLPQEPILSFSGGVADCMEHREDWKAYGDLGPLLGEAIRESRLCEDLFYLGKETIRATVIGAGCHSTQLSGSTVFLQNVALPLQNLRPQVLSREVPLGEQLGRLEPDPDRVLVLPWQEPMDYGRLRQLAEELSRWSGPYYLCIKGDFAKALGQALALHLPENTGILCLDGIGLSEGSYLDVGEPVGPAIPVVVKTLVLGNT